MDALTARGGSGGIIALDPAGRMVEHRRTLRTASAVDKKILSLFEAHLVISEDRVASLVMVKDTYDRTHPAGLAWCIRGWCQPACDPRSAFVPIRPAVC